MLFSRIDVRPRARKIVIESTAMGMEELTVSPILGARYPLEAMKIRPSTPPRRGAGGVSGAGRCAAGMWGWGAGTGGQWGEREARGEGGEGGGPPIPAASSPTWRPSG